MRKRHVIILIALALALAFTTPGKKSISVVQAQNVDETSRFRGYVLPARQVELIAPLENLLTSIEVDEGDRVKKGDVLAKLDDRMQKVEVEKAKLRSEAKAEMLSQKLALEQAKIDHQRIKEAFDKGAASELELRRAKLAVDQADAAVDGSRETGEFNKVELRLQQERLALYQVLAPFDGTVIRLNAEPGAMLTRTEHILLLADLDTLEANINLPEQLFGQLKVGSTYKISTAHHGDLSGKLKTIDPIIDTASRTFRVVIAIDNPKAKLPAGFTVYMAWPQSK